MCGYNVIIANSRGPEALSRLVDELGPAAKAGTAAEAAEAGAFVVVAVPLKLANVTRAAKPAGSATVISGVRSVSFQVLLIQAIEAAIGPLAARRIRAARIEGFNTKLPFNPRPPNDLLWVES